MKTKVCSKCKVEKHLLDFHKDKYTKDKRTTVCKQCRNDYRNFLRKTLKGFLQNIYTHQKETSKRRGHCSPLYTFKEFSQWFVLQKNWENLWLRYQASGYDRNLAPSVDRLDDNKGYSFDNIRLITAYENAMKQINKNKKPVNKYDTQGRYIQTFESIVQAAKEPSIKTSSTTIIGACNGKYRHAGGCQWRYLSSEFPKNKNISPIRKKSAIPNNASLEDVEQALKVIKEGE